MNDWKSLDLSLFHDCTAQMKFGDFLWNDNFSSRRAMNSLTVGSRRIDSHLIANNVHSISDFTSQGNYLPDEGATSDEIRKIQGKMFDAMIALFRGFNMYQTILTCVYAHKEYQIKNEVLRCMILSYTNLVRCVQSFVSKYSLHSSAWALEAGSLDLMHDSVDPKQLREDLLRIKQQDPSVDDIVDFSLFLVDFQNYISDPSGVEFPTTQRIPSQSESIGFSDVLHNRKLPTQSPPQLMQIKNHEESIKEFNDMMNAILEFKNYFSDVSSLVDLIDRAFNWGIQHQNLIILPRFLLYAYLFPKPSNAEKEPKQGILNKLLIEGFEKYHVPKAFFDSSKDISDSIFTISQFAIKPFLMPISFAHHSFTRQLNKYLGTTLNYFMAAQHSSIRLFKFPKTDSESITAILASPLLQWGLFSNKIFLKYYLQLSIEAKVYNPLDYCALFYFLSHVHREIAESYSQQRLIDAAYELSSSQKNKNKRLTATNIKRRQKPESALEIEHKILSSYYDYCIYLMMFVLKTKSIKLPSNEFYNPEKTYSDRKRTIDLMNCIQFMPYDNFHLLYGYNSYNIDRIKFEAKRKFEAIKEIIKKRNDIGNPPEWIKDLLRKSVVSSLTLVQWKEGSKYSITFDNFIPNFQLINQ